MYWDAKKRKAQIDPEADPPHPAQAGEKRSVLQTGGCVFHSNSGRALAYLECLPSSDTEDLGDVRPMPIVKSTLLSNGYSWRRKRDAKKHFADILRRYEIGQRVTCSYDHGDLFALATAYERAVPDWNKGTEQAHIAYFEKGFESYTPKRVDSAKCFYAVTLDGTRVPFNASTAIDVIG